MFGNRASNGVTEQTNGSPDLCKCHVYGYTFKNTVLFRDKIGTVHIKCAETLNLLAAEATLN